MNLIASLVKNYHLVVVQELRDALALQRLASTLGEHWQASISRPVGRGTQERYGFLFRTDRLAMTKPLIVYPDAQDIFIREPATAYFSTGTWDFSVVNIHVVYGQNLAERRMETAALADVSAYVINYYNDNDVLICGDFNLPPSDESFAFLTNLDFRTLNSNYGTTIADNPYDNMWISRNLSLQFTGTWGIDRFDETLFLNDDSLASLQVSDHRPVWALFEPPANQTD